MDWLGIPFPLNGNEVFYHGDFVLKQMPKIVVESDSGWIIFASLVSALLAGGLPAIMAWKAIRSTAESLQKQMAHQEQMTKLALKTEIESKNQTDYIEELVNAAAECVAAAEAVKFVMQDATKSFGRNDSQERQNHLLDLQKEKRHIFSVASWKMLLHLEKRGVDYSLLKIGMNSVYKVLNDFEPTDIEIDHDTFNSGLNTVRDAMKEIIAGEFRKLQELTNYKEI
jgi:propanediol dehydratase small subunit